MTNMTRRNFLKSAGVMALAVAAAGVLSGCDGSSKNPVMETVNVEYWYKGFGSETPIENHKYDETVSVVKGSEKFKKEQLTKLGDACSKSGTTYYANKVPDEIEAEWETKTPTVKIYLHM